MRPIRKSNRKDDRFEEETISPATNGNVLGPVVTADSLYRFAVYRGLHCEAILSAAPHPGVHKSGRCPDRVSEPLAPGQWTAVINSRRSGNCESPRHDDLIIVNSAPSSIC